jgi:ABC-type branched-subunit amino acid transport system ATPase component/sugar phosphate permease
MTATAPISPPGAAPPPERTALAPSRTPRPAFQVTRRLVGVSRYPLILMTAAYAVSISDQYLLSTVFPYLKTAFALSDVSLGLLGSSYAIIVTIGTVPFGILADRASRTKVIAWASAIWGIAMLSTGLATGYVTLFLSRIVLGGASPAVVPNTQSLLADYYPVHQRSKVLGVYQIGQLIGFFLIPIGAAMAAAWGWRSAFYFFAAPGFVIAMLSWRLAEPSRGQQDLRHQGLTAAEPAQTVSSTDSASDTATVTEESLPWREAYLEILRVRTFTIGMISSSIGSLFFGGVGVWAVTFLLRYHNLTVPQAAIATSLFALGGLVGALSAGYIADYLTYTGRRSARVLVAGGARLIGVPLYYVAFTVSNTAVMLVFFTLGAFAIIAAIPPLNAVRLDVLRPQLRGRGTALDTVLQSLAGAASPVIFGILSDSIGLRGAFVVLIPALGIAGLLLLLFALRTYPVDEAKVLAQVAAEAGSTPTEPRPADRPHLANAAASADIADGRAEIIEPTEDESPPPEALEDLLVLEDVCFSYGAIQVLFNTNVRIRRGGCHALLGRNGVGKTTLLAVIGGLLEPQAGQAWFNGQEIFGVPPEQRARLGITLMAGGQATFPSLSLKDNLWLGAYPFAEHKDLIEERLAEVLDIFPALSSRLGQAAGTLSGGEQQMMSLGRALMAGPDLLLIDELSMGLAPVITNELLRVIRRVVEHGTTVIMVEQSVTAALSVADNVLFMDKSGIRELGAPADLADTGLIARLMLRGTDGGGGVGAE